MLNTNEAASTAESRIVQLRWSAQSRIAGDPSDRGVAIALMRLPSPEALVDDEVEDDRAEDQRSEDRHPARTR